MIRLLEKHRFVAFILTLVIAIEIFAFSSIPGNAVSSGGSVWFSRLYHMTIFFLFSFFLLMLIQENKKINPKKLGIALIISLLYAASDEIHQLFVPFRGAGVEDFLTDSIGIFLSVMIFIFYKKKSGNKRFSFS